MTSQKLTEVILPDLWTHMLSFFPQRDSATQQTEEIHTILQNSFPSQILQFFFCLSAFKFMLCCVSVHWGQGPFSTMWIMKSLCSLSDPLCPNTLLPIRSGFRTVTLRTKHRHKGKKKSLLKVSCLPPWCFQLNSQCGCQSGVGRAAVRV